MNPIGTVFLEFAADLDAVSDDKKLSDGLSAVTQVGRTVWVANDEALSLERLSLTGTGNPAEFHARNHARFALGDYLRLPDTGEADIEGLAYDDGYLWLVGSHSLKRKRPKLADDAEKVRKKLKKLEGDGNRYLLARIPVGERGAIPTLARDVVRNGDKRTAAQLQGDKRGNDLIDALRADEHLAPFLPVPPEGDSKEWRGIPGKDNGFDIEGLAVAGSRLFLGLRGPVLRGWAIILELEPEADAADPSMLKLKRIGPDDRPYRKHFLQLGGLGIRDLCVHGADLLILAGPTMDLDGPVSVFRWPNGAKHDEEAVVWAGGLKPVLDIPFGQGEDHAEGMTLFSPDGGEAMSVLIVYDSASASRRHAEHTLTADIFAPTENRR